MEVCLVELNRDNHQSNCGSDYCGWEHIGGDRTVACSFYLDLLLCGKVCFLSLHPDLWIIVVLPFQYELCFVVICGFQFRTKRLGWVLKIVLLMALPVPLILWPIMATIGSLLGAIGYGFFAPLLATFEAVGENVKEKFYHCFVVSL